LIAAYQQVLHDAFAGAAVAERVGPARHGRVGVLAVEHVVDRRHNRRDVCADELCHAGLDRFEAFAGVAHHQNRLAQ
jgi:hypothetical protein